jgi:NAD+ kinase
MLAETLGAGGYTPIVITEDSEACGLPLSAVSRSEVGSPGLVVALGGDGTILKAVHVLAGADAPILGVNFGQLGFLTGADGDDLAASVSAALAGEARVERRQTVQAHIDVGGRRAGHYHALNEVFVGRGGGARVVELEVSVNGTRLWRFACDGVLVATPTGSTAYALSAGGPAIAPEVRGMLLVPVSAHTLKTRPLVLGPTDVVEITSPNAARADACITVDGDAVPCRTSLDRVTVSVGDHDVRLLKLDGRGFYEVLAEKLLGD